MRALASALQHLTQLQHLPLARSQLGNAGLAALAPALSAIPGLQTLGVDNNLVSGTEGAKALCMLLGTVPGLTHLDVSYCSLRNEGAALLAAVLRGLTCLQTLDISSISIGDSGMVTVAPALAALPHLHTLNVIHNQFGAGAVSMLQPVLAREGSPLRRLDLSFMELRVKGAQSLASGLSTATQLQELNLRNTAIGHHWQGWVALVPAFRRLEPSLQSLQLAFESLDNAGTGALATALETLTIPTCLRAARVFTSAAMVIVSPVLMGMRWLQVLEMRYSIWGNEGTTAFVAVLPALSGSLKHLTLFAVELDAEAAANALAPALAQAVGLVELRCGCNGFGQQGAQWLVPVLSTLPHLRTVDLQCCKLRAHGCMAVARALKDRDGAAVYLARNGVAHAQHSTEGDELYTMPGINILL